MYSPSIGHGQVVFEALQPHSKHSFPFDCFRTLQAPSCQSFSCPHLTSPQTFCTSPILGSLHKQVHPHIQN